MERWFYCFQKLIGVCAVNVHKSLTLFLFTFSILLYRTLCCKGFQMLALKTLYCPAFQRVNLNKLMINQTSYLYKTLATCGFAPIDIF